MQALAPRGVPGREKQAWGQPSSGMDGSVGVDSGSVAWRGSRTDRTRVVLLPFLLRAGSERGRGIRPQGLNRWGCEGQVSFLTHQLRGLGQVT